MIQIFRRIIAAFSLTVLLVLGSAGPAQAAPDMSQNPQAGSIGLEGMISTAAPSRAATITTPGNGAAFSKTPITVAGLCPSNLLIKIFDNNVFVGSVVCEGGSYSLQVDLFSGSNQLVARDYDALDQAGPDSNSVTVTFNDAQFVQFGTRVALTSAYARRGANPGDELDWPLLLSGGVGPYAISTDWGDGSAPVLQSESFTGTITIKHTYTNAGIYKVVVRATDKNGTSAYLQLIAVADGAAQTNANSKGSGGITQVKTVVLWWPLIILVPLLFISFWLGRRHELFVLRKQLDDARRQ